MINEYRKISGGEYVGFNNAVFLSETNTADRNYALAYFMKENGCFPPGTGNLKEALDFYFQLCSLEVTCEGMAVRILKNEIKNLKYFIGNGLNIGKWRY